MSVATFAQLDRMPNRELQKLAENVVEVLKLCIVQGMNATINPKVYKYKPSTISVGGRTRKSYPTTALVVSERLKSFDQNKINSVRAALSRDASLTGAIRARGIDICSTKSVIEQLDLKTLFSFVNGRNFSEDAIVEMVRDIYMLDEASAASLKTTSKQAVVNRGVKFSISEVKCIDETDPEWPGSDEISWGGAATDDKGNVFKIAEKKLGGGFNDGTKKRFSPPQTVQTFDIDDVYPKQFMVMMSLAEKDAGGMAQFIQRLYEAVKAEVVLIMTALGAAAGAAIGSAMGGSVGTAVGGPLGTIIGVAAGFILGALVGWLIAILHDDIFAPQASSLFLYAADNTFAGDSLTSPSDRLYYRDHGGYYSLTYHWEITR